MNDIVWTPAMLARMKRTYAAARTLKRDSFVFDGHEYVTDFAKYLIEYLDERFFPSPPKEQPHGNRST